MAVSRDPQAVELPPAVAEVYAAAERVLGRTRTFSARGWLRHRRDERVFAVVQDLADIAADAERRERRAVPRIKAEPGAGLTDQLAVMVHDVAATGDPQACRRASLLLAELARAL